jgi:flagellar hook protein FlgE
MSKICWGFRGLQALIGVALLVGLCRTVEAQIVFTDSASDLAIDGPGWFVLRDPDTGKYLLTRRGDFSVGWDGTLNDASGFHVQGYSNPGLSVVGDLCIDTSGSSSSTGLSSYSFSPDGRLTVTQEDGTCFVRGQILLQDYQGMEQLQRYAYACYRVPPGLNPPQELSIPAQNGLGALLSGYRDLTPEPVRLTLKPNATQTGPLTEGLLSASDRRSDLGIFGSGFFLLRDTRTSELFATRAGMFLRDLDGYLVSYDGKRVQGYSDPARTIPGDVRIDTPASTSSEALAAFYFSHKGIITTIQADGTSAARGQVGLYSFQHPEQLTATNLSLYKGVLQAQPVAATDSEIHAGTLELINLTPELLAQRSQRSWFNQGCIYEDDTASHLAICGNGFFVVRNPADGALFVTRNGRFDWDASGYLTTATGLRVQGCNDSLLTVIGDLRLDTDGSPNPAIPISTCAIDSTGRLIVTLQDDTCFTRGQVLLQTFGDPSLLKACGNDLYTNLIAAGALPQPQRCGTWGLGVILSRSREVPDPPLTFSLPSRQGPRLEITGEPGQRWTIQASTNLAAWTPLLERTTDSDQFEFTDTNAPQFQTRFYRVQVTSP